MGILEKIAEIEGEVCILRFTTNFCRLSGLIGEICLSLDGPNAEEQGYSTPSWIVKSTVGEVTTRTNYTKRRRRSARRGLVKGSNVCGRL